eukprot:Nk52_evm1s1960 gene=Nk52_evmTU1s1960
MAEIQKKYNMCAIACSSVGKQLVTNKEVKCNGNKVIAGIDSYSSHGFIELRKVAEDNLALVPYKTSFQTIVGTNSPVTCKLEKPLRVEIEGETIDMNDVVVVKELPKPLLIPFHLLEEKGWK